MEEVEPKKIRSRRGIGGPKPKEASEKSTCKVGGFWLKPAEKAQYDHLFSLSKLKNHTAFFRSIFFDGKLKLYCSDSNTLPIFESLVHIGQDIEHIRDAYEEVAKRLNEETSDTGLYDALGELHALSRQLIDKIGEGNELLSEYMKLKKKKVKRFKIRI
jgi:hypothetical protein